MKYLLLLLFLFPSFAFSQDGPISIYLKTGDRISTQYVYLNSNGGFLSRPHVRIDDKRGDKIPIERVEHIEGTDQHGEYKYIKPIYLNGAEIWGERTFSSERVEIYYTNIISGTWTTSYKSKYFQYSADGQPLKKLTYANLRKDIGHHPGAREHLKKGNMLRITQFLLYGAGAALVVGGIANGLGDKELRDPIATSLGIPPALIAGAITLYIPWFINSPKQKHFVKALKSYQ